MKMEKEKRVIPYIQKVQKYEKQINELINECKKELTGHYLNLEIKDGRVVLFVLFNVKKLDKSPSVI
jgi:hypothetical protein